jgi:hypothetical protein
MNPPVLATWGPLFTANDPETFSTANSVPLLIIQGGADEQVPVVSTELLAEHLCGLGQDLERWVYIGRSHAGVVFVSVPDMVHWIADRIAGDPGPDPYAPIGQTQIETTSC